MSVSKEDFLKAVYHLSYDDGLLPTASLLAERLQVSNAAITDMARKCNAEGLLEYSKYKPIRLSQKGLKRATQVIRKHRLWESFLHKVLDIPPHAIHSEAEMLEHATSDRLTDRIDEFLGYPHFDPHGDPIPGKDGKVPSSDGVIPLNTAEPGIYLVSRLQHRVPEVVEFYRTHGIEMNKLVEVTMRHPEIGTTTLLIQNETMVIADAVASQIFIQKLK